MLCYAICYISIHIYIYIYIHVYIYIYIPGDHLVAQDPLRPGLQAA